MVEGSQEAAEADEAGNGQDLSMMMPQGWYLDDGSMISCHTTAPLWAELLREAIKLEVANEVAEAVVDDAEAELSMADVRDVASRTRSKCRQEAWAITAEHAVLEAAERAATPVAQRVLPGCLLSATGDEGCSPTRAARPQSGGSDGGIQVEELEGQNQKAAASSGSSASSPIMAKHGKAVLTRSTSETSTTVALTPHSEASTTAETLRSLSQSL